MNLCDYAEPTPFRFRHSFISPVTLLKLATGEHCLLAECSA